MESKVKVMGHPIHPILIVFPYSLLSTSVLFDVAHLLTDSRAFALVSFWTLIGGLLGGLAASVPGWIDWFAIPGGTRAKRSGLIDGLGNGLVLILFGLSWFLRRDNPAYLPSTSTLWLSFTAFFLAIITGWLSAEWVGRLDVGVNDHAKLNVPSSLSGRSTADKQAIQHTVN